MVLQGDMAGDSALIYAARAGALEHAKVSPTANGILTNCYGILKKNYYILGNYYGVFKNTMAS